MENTIHMIEATDFATPIYMQEDTTAAAAGSAGSGTATVASVSGGSPAADAVDFADSTISTDSAVAAATAATIDLNDPIFMSEDLDSNADVNAYDQPPPVNDGKWRAKLKQIDVKLANGEQARYKAGVTKKGTPYLMTALQASIQDPSGKFDNVSVFDRFVSTMPARNGGIPVVRLLTCLGVKLPAKVGHKSLMDLLLKSLGGEPDLEIETAWEAQYEMADQEEIEAKGVRAPSFRGQRRWPEDGKGGHVAEMDVEVAGRKYHVRAQARIVGYFPLGK